MPNKKNNNIRIEARTRGVSLWQIAQKLNISETTLVRWLRYDLEPERLEAIMTAIDTIAEELYGKAAQI